MIMTLFLVILAFVAIGALIGFLGTRMFEGANLWISIVVGLVGSFGASWLAKILGLGTGFMSFSMWGVVFGILGACLLVAVYGFIARRRANG